MMVWEGVETNQGINWESPTPLKKFLTEIPLEQLDFLPDGFSSEVEANLPIDGAH